MSQIPRRKNTYAYRAHLRVLLLAGIAVLIAWTALTGYTAKLDKANKQSNQAPKDSPATSKSLEGSTRANLDKNYGSLPLSFEVNLGQTDASVKYTARGPGYNIFLTETEAVLVFRAGQKPAKARLPRTQDFDDDVSAGARGPRALRDRDESQSPEASEPTVLRMRLDGANSGARAIEGVDRLPGKLNYFLGTDPTKWRTDISTYGKVSYRDAYPGIDLVFYGNQRQLEYDLVVAPGADPGVIKLKFDGAKNLRVDAEGNLVIQTPGGEVRQGKPTIFQEVNGVRKEIVGGYELKSGNRVGFKLKGYDRSRPLVIDPILSYLSIVGSGGFASAIAVDQDGSAYITGTIESFEQLPPTSGAFQIAHGGGLWDVFVTKLNAAGTGVVYSTYIGGNGDDSPLAIAVDANKNAYLTGYTGGTYPTTAGAFRTVRQGGYEAMVTKLSPTGSSLIYSTFFGGNGYEEGDNLKVDSSGSAYVSGTSDSTNLPTTAGAVQSANAGGYDGFVVKFNPTGGGVDYCTYLGGNAFDGAFDIALDNSNNVYVVGHTGSLNYPVVNSLQQHHGTTRGTFKSTNNGASWTLARNGLGGGNINALAIDPTNPSVVYAATPGGVWKTIDSGANWSPTGTIHGHVYSLAIDPVNTAILYAGTNVGAFKTINGGTSWTLINNGLLPAPGPNDQAARPQSFAIDRNTPTTVYAATFRGMFKTTNGGNSWTGINTGLSSTVLRGVVIDPSNSSILYAISGNRIFKSTDAGATWTRLTNGVPPRVAFRGLTIDPVAPATLYFGTEAGVYKTNDAGANWAAANNGLLQPWTDGVSRVPNISALAIDPIAHTNIYGAAGFSVGQGFLNSGAYPLATVFKSVDGGGTWTPVTNGFNNLNSDVFSLAINPVNPSIIYAGAQGDAETFVTKLNPTSTSLAFSSYLGGALPEYSSGVGLDAAGAVYITGNTQSLDFPTTQGAIQTSRQGGTDAFVTKIGANNAVAYSTYLGGGGTEETLGLVVDSTGNAYVAGRTDSNNFPTTAGSFQTKIGNPGDAALSDAFISKLNPAGNGFGYSSYLGGPGDERNPYGITSFCGLGLDLHGNAYIVGVTSDQTTFPEFNLVNRSGTVAYFPYGSYVAKVSETTPSYSITGRVTDTQDAPIVGITVEAKNSQGFSQTVGTDSQGFYAVISLPAGDYTLTPGRTPLNDSTKHYVYAPPTRTVLGLNADQTGADFTGTRVFDIRGLVTSSTTGVGVFDVTITATGSSTVTTTTDANGNYSLQNLVAGGSYTISPSKDGFTFSPDYSFPSVTGDLSQVDFTTPSATFFTVSGRIANANNSGIPNVPITTLVTSMQGSRTFTTQTDANGEYVIHNLQAGGNYTFTPAKANFIFSPASRSFNNLAADHTEVNFQAMEVLAIRGRVTISGEPLSGVTMTLSGGAAAVTTTDANGDYSFINLPAGNNFTLTPSKTHYSFAPVSLIFSGITVDQNAANFSGTPVKYTISGNISESGTPLSAVSVNLSGSQTAATTTNNNGDYSFTNLDGSGNYTVTPTKVNYSFAPTNLTFNNLSANQTAANFVGTRTGYTILVRAYRAVPNQPGVSGVTVTLTGSTTATGVTNAGGLVSFDNLQPGGNYTVTPSLANFGFNPTSRTFNNLMGDQLAEFERIAAYRVSGGVADAKGNGIPGVTIIVGVQGDPPPTGPGVTTTDANGNYILDFTPIVFNVNYAVYPSKAGYSFSPILFRNGAGVDIPGISLGLFTNNQPVNAVANFLATHSISGRVTDSNGGVSGVTLTALGQGSVTTDANGNYSFPNLPAGNDYAITPTKAGLAFAPPIRIFTALGANQAGVNFAAQPVHTGFEPVVLTTDQVEIKTWTFQGHTYAYVKLLFPNGGYSVINWGQAVKTVNDFAADATIERSTGLVIQAVTTTAQIYDLGPLADGNYTFTFKNSGVLVKSQAFAVSWAVPPPNPIDNAREFVRQQYRDFLNREADPAGEDFWTDNITKCSDPARRPPGQTEAECTLRQRETTSGAFFLSPESQYTSYFVYRMYVGGLGRQPKLSEFTRDALAVSNGIIVNGQLSAAKINQNKAAFAEEFVDCSDRVKYRCSEFKAIYDGLNNQQYVDKLFQTTGVNASAADRAALVNGLNANPATETRASVLQKVVDGINVIAEGNQQFTTTYGEAFYNAELNRAFVLLEYFGYMRRDPDEAGYAFWLAKLNQFNGDFVKAEMVLAFISSPEYRARFGAP